MKRILSLVLVVLLLASCMGGAKAEVKKHYRYSSYVYTLLDDGTAEIVGYEGYGKKIVVSGWVNGSIKVTSIGETAFSGYKDITSVEISENVTHIGDRAFMNCSSLESVVIPNTVQTLGHNPFMGCSNLTKIEVADDHPTLATIDGVLFSKPDKRLVTYPNGFTATSYEIPRGIKVIDAYAFVYSDLLDITIPDTVKTIARRAFYGCDMLTTVALPDSVEEIGGNPFYGCDKLIDIQVSADHPTLATIDGVLFSKADKRLVTYPVSYKQKSYEIPRGIRIIGDGAFAYASAVENVTIPDTVTTIEEDAFFYSRKLAEAIIPDSVTSIGAGAFQGTDITKVRLSSALKVIPDSAFSGCRKLTELELPEGLEIIEFGAFHGCDGVETVVIPEGVTTLGRMAFGSCDKLKEVTLPATLTDIDDDSFYRCEALEMLHVVSGSYAAKWAKANDLPYTAPGNLDWLLE